MVTYLCIGLTLVNLLFFFFLMETLVNLHLLPDCDLDDANQTRTKQNANVCVNFRKYSRKCCLTSCINTSSDGYYDNKATRKFPKLAAMPLVFTHTWSQLTFFHLLGGRMHIRHLHKLEWQNITHHWPCGRCKLRKEWILMLLKITSALFRNLRNHIKQLENGIT